MKKRKRFEREEDPEIKRDLLDSRTTEPSQDHPTFSTNKDKVESGSKRSWSRIPVDLLLSILEFYPFPIPSFQTYEEIWNRRCTTGFFQLTKEQNLTGENIWMIVLRMRHVCRFWNRSLILNSVSVTRRLFPKPLVPQSLSLPDTYQPCRIRPRLFDLTMSRECLFGVFRIFVPLTTMKNEWMFESRFGARGSRFLHVKIALPLNEDFVLDHLPLELDIISTFIGQNIPEFKLKLYPSDRLIVFVKWQMRFFKYDVRNISNRDSCRGVWTMVEDGKDVFD